MKKEKKYIIELNERQARLLSYACDQFARLIQGQDAAFQDLMEMAWEKRCKNATGNMMDKEWDGGWHAMREEAERTCREIKRKFWGGGSLQTHSTAFTTTTQQTYFSTFTKSSAMNSGKIDRSPRAI